MTQIADLIASLAVWNTAKAAYHRGEKSPFLLQCQLSGSGAQREEFVDLQLGPDLEAFLRLANGADLFKDAQYGQWGLRLLSAREIQERSDQGRSETPEEVRDTDYIIGEFYGDSDQLILDASRHDQGLFPVMVRLPIDERSDWPYIADSFAEFLERYLKSEGDKYWEP